MKLRRVVAVAIGALGLSLGVALPAQAAVQSNITTPYDGQHVTQGDSLNVNGDCRQVGPNAVVASCTIRVFDSSGSILLQQYNEGGGQNIVSFLEPLPTGNTGQFHVSVTTDGTGTGEAISQVSYFVDAPPPPPPPPGPPSVSISGPGAGTAVNPGASLSLSSSCSAGARASLTSCNADVSGPGGSHTSLNGFGGALPTGQSGNYSVTVTATQNDGQTATGSTSYRVNTPPTASISAPSAGTAVNPGTSLTLSSGCTAGPGSVLDSCSADVTHPDGSHTIVNGFGGALPTADSGDYSVTVTATQSGLTATASTWYRVNTPPHINTPTSGTVINQGTDAPWTDGCAQGTGQLTQCTTTITDPNGNPVNFDGTTEPTGAPGTYHVHIFAEDSNGLTATSDTTYRVNAYPTVDISSPLQGLRVYTGTPVPAAYSCADFESTFQANDPSCVGTVPVGANVDTSPAGPKSFSVTAVDGDGASASQTVTYNVYDKPTVQLSSPAVNTVVNPGGSAPTFIGSCAGGVPNVVCTMTLTAPDGTVSTLTSGETLPITQYGSWLVTVHVIDDFGTQQTATRYYKVNEAPHVVILTPANGDTFFQGQNVTPVYSCYDNDHDGNITPDTITSCTGPAGPLATQSTTIGVHTYTVTAVDNDGAVTTQTVSYKVVPVVGPCQGTGLRLLNTSFGQSGVADPCKTGDQTTVRATANIGPKPPPGKTWAAVIADVIDGHTVRTQPATFSARADVTDVTVTVPSVVTLKVTGVHTTAASTLTSCSSAQLTGTSTVATLVLNGKTIKVGTAPLTIPLAVGTLYLNQRVTTATGITERAVFLDLPGTALDVVVAESTVAPRCGTLP